MFSLMWFHPQFPTNSFDLTDLQSEPTSLFYRSKQLTKSLLSMSCAGNCRRPTSQSRSSMSTIRSTSRLMKNQGTSTTSLTSGLVPSFALKNIRTIVTSLSDKFDREQFVCINQCMATLARCWFRSAIVSTFT